jgi:hypothetical protein
MAASDINLRIKPLFSILLIYFFICNRLPHPTYHSVSAAYYLVSAMYHPVSIAYHPVSVTH